MSQSDEVLFTPVTNSQRAVVLAWGESKILFLTGPAGTGKTHAAFGLALRDRNKRDFKIMLSRPLITCDHEDMGFLPGDKNEKLSPWMAPYADVLSSMSHMSLSDLSKRIEFVPIGFLRGRSINNAVLIVDEAQNLTWKQLECIVTRVGLDGKVVLCGDPRQSDIYDPMKSPLLDMYTTLSHIDGVTHIKFTKNDVVRSGFVGEVLRALNPGV